MARRWVRVRGRRRSYSGVLVGVEAEGGKVAYGMEEAGTNFYADSVRLLFLLGRGGCGIADYAVVEGFIARRHSCRISDLFGWHHGEIYGVNCLKREIHVYSRRRTWLW